MTVKLDDVGMESVHVDSATGSKTMNRRMKRKLAKRESASQPPLPEKKSGKRRGRKGLNMKIAADGSMSIRHMSELGSGLAFMPPVEIVLED